MRRCEPMVTGMVKRDRRFEGVAIVDCEICPHQRGRVYFRAGWWLAKCDREIVFSPGDKVQVIGIEEITLLVQPLTDEP